MLAMSNRGGAFLVIVALATTIAWADHAVNAPPVPDQLRPPDHRDDGFVFCRLHYDSDRVERDGSGWNTDHPLAERHFMIRLQELTSTRVEEGQQWVVSIDSDEMFLCPFLVTSDVGTMRLLPEQATRLRTYLVKGGVLWVDDFWGTFAWERWLRELHKVLPEAHIVTPTFDHPLYRTHYRITKTLQVSNLGHWERRGHTAERDEDSPVTPLRVVTDDHGRVMVVMTHNSDIQDTWERETDNHAYFMEFSPDGYALGINVLLYAMTH